MPPASSSASSQRRFAEHVHHAVRVHREVAVLGRVGAPDQRLGQAMRVVRVVEAVAALDAQPLVVGRAVAAFDVEDLVVLDVVGELAADAAVRAHRVDLLVGHRERRRRAPASARRSGRPARIRRRRRRSTRPSGRPCRTRSSRARRGRRRPMTSLTCSSRQARRQRVHWMQASRLTAMAGCDRSCGDAARAPRSAACRRRACAAHCVDFVVARVVASRACRTAAARAPASATCSARSLSVVTFMPAVGRAAARRREHALAVDLDHAGAAVADRARARPCSKGAGSRRLRAWRSR